MDGERITMRLESEDLELLDGFLQKHPEYASRSHLTRIAIRQFIEGAQGPQVSEERAAKVTVELPRAALYVIEAMVREGIFTTAGGAIEEAVRKEFLKPEYLEEMKKKVLEARETVKILP
ncbi:MAG: ribbon-helix-helix domain-containing protein [Methanomassiliicoccales archaeon]|jgi:Arc/MetJ-type ribon-helix-helix transcriptional regulator